MIYTEVKRPGVVFVRKKPDPVAAARTRAINAVRKAPRERVWAIVKAIETITKE